MYVDIYFQAMLKNHYQIQSTFILENFAEKQILIDF